MLYQSCWNNLVTGLIVPSSLLQFVNSLLQTCSNKFGTSSANTSCEQFVNRLVTTCLQVCSNLCVFTCVVQKLEANSNIADFIGLSTSPCAIMMEYVSLTSFRLGSTRKLATYLISSMSRIKYHLLVNFNHVNDRRRTTSRVL